MNDEEPVFIWSLKASEEFGISHAKMFDLKGNGQNEM